MAEFTKIERISQEYKKLRELYRNMPENKQILLEPLIQNASFMKVTLEDLQEIINFEGSTDEYCNGANQYGRKISANIQAYNSLAKNYNSVIDKLEKLLPPETKRSKLSELVE